MYIDGTELEEVLKRLLQKNLRFLIGGKVFKKGKLILFKQNNYHLELTVQKEDETKRFEIPVPFDVEEWEEDGLVYFDYRFSTLSKGNAGLQNLIKKLPKQGKSKFYDTILEIEVD